MFFDHPTLELKAIEEVHESVSWKGLGFFTKLVILLKILLFHPLS
jgi:hypothetical protein